ncbi:MAG: hypothetical protein JSV65_04515 [Armatimonadota bacterium]|nr:MAG: hypothetical protein JSV65_04515 [Armatimonadota bacterium]
MSATPVDGEEFCTKPPWLALWAVYLNAAMSYGVGGLMLISWVFFIGLMVWGLATRSLSLALFGHYFGDVELVLGLAAVPVLAIFMLRTGWLSLRAIRLGRELSLKVGAVAIHVRDRRGNQYEIGMKQIERLEVRKSFWLGTRTYIWLASGERHRLPQRVRDHNLLIEKIAKGAGLTRRYQPGRSDVYSRDTEYEPEG